MYFFLAGRFGLWLLTFLGAWALVFADQLTRHHGILARRLSKSTFDPGDVASPDARATARLAQLQTAQDGNVSVYSGFVPFVGSGTNIMGWSFVVDTTRPASDSQPGRAPIPFTVEELNDHIAGAIRHLDLPGLTVADRLYVDGRDIRDDTRWRRPVLQHRSAGGRSQRARRRRGQRRRPTWGAARLGTASARDRPAGRGIGLAPQRYPRRGLRDRVGPRRRRRRRAEHPDRASVTDRLDRVATGVASLTGLTEAVNVLLGAAGRLL